MIPWLADSPVFPTPDTALTEPNGLLAAGGDLSATRLLAAYRCGIFPWFADGDPLLWWSPDPRMVLIPGEMKVTRSLARTLRNADYEVRLDSDFAAVVSACANTPRDGQPGTWITRGMQLAYAELHRLGYAHSVETWIDGELVGGLYGVALGAAFYGESMFSHRRDASKIALAHLCAYLSQRGFGIIDCQMETNHLSSLGAKPIPRRDFLAALESLTPSAAPSHHPGKWSYNAITGHFK
jgi:leucyl/phenylalanyl-tRNA--protein transferase